MIGAALALLGPVGRFLKPYAGYLLIAALAGLALWAFGHHQYQAGVKHEQAAQAEAVEKAKKRVLEGDKKAVAITTKAEAEHVRTVEKIRWRTETLTKEIKVYVPQEVDAGYRLPNGLVSLHDQAATGVSGLSVPSGELVGAPSVVAPSQLAAAFVSNYGTCYTWQSEALTWRKWFVDQRDNYNATTGQKP